MGLEKVGEGRANCKKRGKGINRRQAQVLLFVQVNHVGKSVIQVVSGLQKANSTQSFWWSCCDVATKRWMDEYLQHQPRADFVVQFSVVLEEGVDNSKATDLCACET